MRNLESVALRNIIFSFCLSFFLASQVSCDSGDLRNDCQVHLLGGEKASQEIKVQLAKTKSERSRGLMYRRKLGHDQGMLFIFPDVSERSFWMKNTFIPLDMIFLDEEGVVVSLLKNVPPHTPSPRLSKKPAKYVLEILGGGAEGYGFIEGSRISLEKCLAN